MENDTLLVKQTLEGDKKAFHHLIEKYQTALYTLILAHVDSHDDAQELAQGVFLEAYRDLASLRQPERFRFWLRRIAINHCQDWQRQKMNEHFSLLENEVISVPSVEESVIQQETLKQVMQAVDELPEMDKAIFMSRYLDNASYKELQEKYNLSYKGVTMRLLHAKERVRKKLKKILFDGVVMHHQNLAKKLIKGGLEIMKLTTKVKVISIVIVVIILGIGGTIIWNSQKSDYDVPDSTITQVATTTNLELHKTTNQVKKSSSISHIVNKDSSGNAINNPTKDKTLSHDIEESVKWLDSFSNENKKQDATKTKTGSFKEEELSPEIKGKAEIFAKLAPILPEFKSIHLPEGPLPPNSPERYFKLLEQIANIGQPYSEPAIHRDETGKVIGYDTEYMFNLIGLHLGKRLPFDGNSDYFSAKEFKLPGNPEDYPYPW